MSKNETRGEVKKNYTVKVTEGILKKSTPENKRWCMVARALREQIDGAWSVSVTSDTIRFNVGAEPGRSDRTSGTRFVYPTPAAVADKICRFDQGKKIVPFQFRLLQTQCYTAPVVKRGKTKKSKHSRKKHRVCNGPRCTVRRFHGIQVVK